jgi:DNA-binding beta-propeller fold protein YncE
MHGTRSPARRGALVLVAGLIAAAPLPAHAEGHGRGHSGKHPSGRTLLYASIWGANHISISDAEKFREIKQIPAQADGPAVLMETPDHSKVYVEMGGPTGRTVGVLDTSRNQIMRHIDMPVMIQGDRATRIQRDGRYYYYSSIPDGKVVQVDTETDQVSRTYDNAGNDFTVSRDGRTIFAWGNTVTAIDAESGEVVGTVDVPDAGIPVATAGFGWTFMSEDGNELIHAANPTHFIDVRDRTKMKVITSVPTGTFPLLADMSPDGHWLWLPNGDDGTISVIDLIAHKLVTTITTGRYMTFTGFDPSGKYVYVAQAREGSPAPMRGTTAINYFAQMGGGGAVTDRNGAYYSRPGLDTPGEIAMYDAATFKQLPRKPIPTVTMPVYLRTVVVP